MGIALRKLIKKFLGVGNSDRDRINWLTEKIANLPNGWRILDAGAGELRLKPFCSHLEYVSQDFCQYDGVGNERGLQTGEWDTSRIDLVCDICSIPELDASFDAILCSEVLEHIPNPSNALNEFSRLLKPGGKLIITAPFASLVHFAPYHFCSGFSRYWYEYHLTERGFHIDELSSNGDWFALCRQEIVRLPSMAKQSRDWCRFFSYFAVLFANFYFLLRVNSQKADEVACFGWQCVATKL